MPAEYGLEGKIRKTHAGMGYEMFEFKKDPETGVKSIKLKTIMPDKPVGDLVGFYWQAFLLNQSTRTHLKHLFGDDFEKIIENAEKEGAKWQNILKFDPIHLFNQDETETDPILVIEGESYKKLYERTREKLKIALSKICDKH